MSLRIAAHVVASTIAIYCVCVCVCMCVCTYVMYVWCVCPCFVCCWAMRAVQALGTPLMQVNIQSPIMVVMLNPGKVYFMQMC